LLAFLFLSGSIYFGVTSYDIFRLVNAGVVTKALVLNEFIRQDVGSEDVCIIYKFRPKGQLTFFQGRGYSEKRYFGKHPEGSSVDVIYDPDNPNRSRWHADDQDKLRLIISLICSAFLLLVGFWFAWSLVKRKPLISWFTPKDIVREFRRAHKTNSVKRIVYILPLCFIFGLAICSHWLFNNFHNIWSSPKLFVVLTLILGISVLVSLLLMLFLEWQRFRLIKYAMYRNGIEVGENKLSYQKFDHFAFTDLPFGKHSYRSQAIPIDYTVSENEIAVILTHAGIEHVDELEVPTHLTDNGSIKS
jgi:hypothetical protein